MVLACVKSPKSAVFPNEAIVRYSIVLTVFGLLPPPINPLTALEHAPALVRTLVKSPKSAPFHNVEIVKY